MSKESEQSRSSFILRMAGVLENEGHVPGTGVAAGNSSTSGIKRKEQPEKNLAANFRCCGSSLIFPQADSQDALLRYAVAQLYKSYLIISEIMFSDIAGMYIHDAIQQIVEFGLYRQKVKKITNEVQAVVDEMNRKSKRSDTDMVDVFCKVIFPYLAKDYVEDGGTLSDSLRLMFRHEFIDELKSIEFATKNVFDLIRVPKSGLGAKLSMVLLITNTLKELKGALEDRVKCSIPGYPGLNSLLSKENERLLAVTQKLMCEIGLWDVDLPGKEGLAARQMAANFQVKLLREEMLGKVQEVIRDGQVEYAKYTIARLKFALMEGDGKLPFGYYRVLLMRLGTHDNVAKLLKVINNLSDPTDKMDAMDYKDELDIPEDGSVLPHFIRLCVEDKIMVPDAVDKLPVKLRTLRTLAIRAGGVLPLEELKKLYKQLGTKKAVAAVLKQAGPEMNDSLKLLKNTKVEALKAA